MGQFLRVKTLETNKLIFLGFAITLASGCFTPKQPPLTNLEKNYMSEISTECHCSVDREIDTRLITKDIAKGDYLLCLNYPNRDILKDTLSLGIYSYKIARNLYYNVLLKGDKYQHILIIHDCKYGTNSFISKDYRYNVDSLYFN